MGEAGGLLFLLSLVVVGSITVGAIYDAAGPLAVGPTVMAMYGIARELLPFPEPRTRHYWVKLGAFWAVRLYCYYACFWAADGAAIVIIAIVLMFDVGYAIGAEFDDRVDRFVPHGIAILGVLMLAAMELIDAWDYRQTVLAAGSTATQEQVDQVGPLTLIRVVVTVAAVGVTFWSAGRRVEQLGY